MTTQENNTRPRIANSRRSWLLAVFLMSAVFLFGAIVGAVVTGRFLWKKHIDSLQRPRFETSRMMRHMQDNFNLTDEQVEQLSTILSNHHQKIETIREEVRAEVEPEIESLRREVDTVLTPEQAKQWDARFTSEKHKWLPPRLGRNHGGPRHGMGRRVSAPGSAYLPEGADADHDGNITVQELNDAFARIAEERFKQLDTDGNGTLSEGEIQAAETLHPRNFRQRPPQ